MYEPDIGTERHVEFFEKNRQLLLRRFPLLARRVEREPDDPNLRLVVNSSGVPNAAIVREGRARFLHESQNPIGQAETVIAKNSRAQDRWNFAVLGMGMGYLPLLLTERKPNAPRFLLVFEPSVAVFRLACQHVDLEPLLGDPSVHFIVGHPSSREIENALFANRWNLISNDIMTIVHPPTADLFPDWIRQTQTLFSSACQRLQGTMTTILLDGPRVAENLVRNLPTYIASPGIRPGNATLRNCPAVIVAAGPSLRRNVHLLRDVHKKAVTIVVDTAFERVLKAGGKPHFVITADPSNLNERHFPRSDYSRFNTRLIYDNCAHPGIPRKFPGKAITYSARRGPFFEWLDRMSGGKGLIRPGAMVSQIAMNIAAFWGCRPIILVGQDLSLDPQSGDTHFEEAAIKRTVRFIDGDPHHAMYPSITSDEYREEPIFWVDGVNGQPVPTVRYLLDYLRILEENISVLQVPVLDATEGGARIAGTTSVTLVNALTRYATEPPDMEQFCASLAAGTQPGDPLPVFRHFHYKADTLDNISAALLERLASYPDESTESAIAWAAETEKLMERSIEQVFRDDILSFFVENVSGQAMAESHRYAPPTAPAEKRADRVRVRCGRLSDAFRHTAELLHRMVRELE